MDPKLKAEMMDELAKLEQDGKVGLAEAARVLEEIHAKARSKLEVWVEAHPVLAFRVGVIAGIIGGGGAVYLTLRILG